MPLPSTRRIAIGLLAATLVAAGSLGVSGSVRLRGSLTAGGSAEERVRALSDIDGNGAVSAREARRALLAAVLGVARRDAAYDLTGDGATDRADLRRFVAALRAVLSAICGNGVREAGEQCDDGNADDGDGCSSACLTEVHEVSLVPIRTVEAPYWQRPSSDETIDWASYIDEGVERAALDPGGYLTTQTILFPPSLDCAPPRCVARDTSSFQLSRVPANVSRVTRAVLRVAGVRGGDGWNDTVRLRLVNADGTLPLTEWEELPALPEQLAHLGARPWVEVPLAVNADAPAGAWQNPRVDIAAGWRYCQSAGRPCPPPPYATQIRLFALEAALGMECDGTCETVTAACGNGEQEPQAGEQCDDGNATDDDACSNTCQPTGNWWIPDLGTLGPKRQLGAGEQPGPLQTLPGEQAIALWYEGYASNTDTYERLLASRFSPGAGWTAPHQLNDGPVYVSANPDARNGLVARPQFVTVGGQTSIFFSSDRTLRRATSGDGSAWESETYWRDALVEDLRAGEGGALVLISGVMQFPDGGAFFPLGLYAVRSHNGGTWSAPTLVAKYEQTAQGQARIAEALRYPNPSAYLATTQPPPGEPARIVAEEENGYAVEWYGTTWVVPAAP